MNKEEEEEEEEDGSLRILVFMYRNNSPSPSYQSGLRLFLREQVFYCHMIDVDDDLASQDIRPELL